MKEGKVRVGEIVDIEAEYKEKRVTLQWPAMENAESYEVIRRTPDTDRWQFLFTGLKDTACADEDVTEAVYIYRVRAVNAAGSGPWSTPLTLERAD